MITRLSDIVAKSRDTLLYDMAGVLALAGFTLGLLHLPGLF